MNIVSNFIGSVSPEMFNEGVKGLTQNIDFGDKTFADLLEKQINNLQNNEHNLMQSFGLPTDIIVGNTDNVNMGVNLGDNMLESIKPINESEKSVFTNLKDAKDMSTSEVVTFFNSLFDSKPTMTDTSSSGLFDFERKTAANQYSKYSRNVVTDLSEFVSDILK